MALRARNLVLCLDGTSNHFSTTNTNVVKLFSVLHSSETQMNYYDSGNGTYLPQDVANNSTSLAAMRTKVSLVADLAIAWSVLSHRLGWSRQLADHIVPTSRNFDDHVTRAYEWLMNYYQYV